METPTGLYCFDAMTADGQFIHPGNRAGYPTVAAVTEAMTRWAERLAGSVARVYIVPGPDMESADPDDDSYIN